jgi:transcriptional regulator with XRE-family HTH domain
MRLAEALQAARRRRGWNMDEVATRAGISRTTLFHLENAAIRRPRASTLHRLAQALDVPVDRLFSRTAVSRSSRERLIEIQYPVDGPPGSVGSQKAIDEQSLDFDRATNPIVGEIAAAEPELFIGWTDDEWVELYSQFATGGALREEGVRITAARINDNRETLYRLRVLLQTHLSDVATGMVNTLYDLVSVTAKEEKKE